MSSFSNTVTHVVGLPALNTKRNARPYLEWGRLEHRGRHLEYLGQQCGGGGREREKEKDGQNDGLSIAAAEVQAQGLNDRVAGFQREMHTPG